MKYLDNIISVTITHIIYFYYSLSELLRYIYYLSGVYGTLYLSLASSFFTKTSSILIRSKELFSFCFTLVVPKYNKFYSYVRSSKWNGSYINTDPIPRREEMGVAWCQHPRVPCKTLQCAPRGVMG